MKSIDLNCDMGESFGAWHMGADAEVMPWVSSINVACGFHAGDPLTMQRTLEAAASAGVAVGAHVGLPDLLGFGRRVMAVTAQELHAMTVVQLGALEAMARRSGLVPRHVKPHGALYHMLEDDTALAVAFVAAIRGVDASLRVVGLAGGHLIATARSQGLGAAAEAFADRRYTCRGRLQSRNESGAVIENVDAASQQALDICVRGSASTSDGSRIEIHADTLCIHGDRRDAANLARTLHERLRAAGVSICAS